MAGIMSMNKVKIIDWNEAPAMDAGAPMPCVYSNESNLFVSYIVSTPTHEDDEEFAIVKFEGVLQFTFGYPNDEAFGAHPLYNLGLKFHSFNVVNNSPYLKELDKRNSSIFPDSKGAYCARFKHWVVPFHDETLEVVGSSVKFVGLETALNGQEALSRFIGDNAI